MFLVLLKCTIYCGQGWITNMNKRFAFYACTSSAAALFLVGCATPAKYNEHKVLFAQGQYLESTKPFEEDLEDREEDGSDARKFALDDMCLGAAYRAGGEPQKSNEAFERAENGIKLQQEASKLGNAMRTIGAIPG